MKRVSLFLLAALLLFTMTACRSRTTAMTTPEPVVSTNTESEKTTLDPCAAPEPVQESVPPPTDTNATEEPPTDAHAPAQEDPASERKEYSDDADAELTPDADTPVIAPVCDPTDAPAVASSDVGAGEETGGNMEIEQADQTATETVPADEADELGTSDNAPVADTVLLYYQTLLHDRLSSLFECQRLYVYWETQAESTTVFKTSAEHQLILDAGAYDVSAKLLEENLTVDAGWIKNKNPGVIVKVVTSDVLGSDIQSTASAQAVKDALLAREGVCDTDAAKNAKVLLFSSELLTTQARRTATAVYLAKAMYPEQIEDVDPDEALRLVTEEAGETATSGVFAYGG